MNNVAPMFGRYWVPGPVEIRAEIMAAMDRPAAPHRGAEAERLFAAVVPALSEIFGTEQPTCVITGSGTAAVESGVRLLPKGRVLCLVNGAFSGRFASIAETCGLDVDRFEVEWGQVHDPAEVATRVAGGGYVGVTAAHSETSTGARQPLAELANATGDTPFLVDSVSGAGAMPIDFDDNGLAFACTGSQKALALPPGLSFAVASDALLDAADPRGFYLDLRAYRKKQPPFTPAMHLVYALEAQLETIHAEGLENRFARHRAMAERTWQWADEVGLKILAPAGARSWTVTCLEVPDAPAFVQGVAEHGYTLGAGYGRLKGSTFRIGHMGDQTPETLEGLLAACADTLG